VLIIFPALVLMASSQSAENEARWHDTAWAVLDEAWAGSKPEYDRVFIKEHILASLAPVESPRATEVFRRAFRTSPSAAATAAGLLSKRRVAVLFPEISAVLKTNREVGIQVMLLGCLKHVPTPEAANVIRPFALEDNKPVIGVAFGILGEMGQIATPVLSEALVKGCRICKEFAAAVLMQVGATTNSAVR
jgi:hypothetical protein